MTPRAKRFVLVVTALLVAAPLAAQEGSDLRDLFGGLLRGSQGEEREAVHERAGRRAVPSHVESRPPRSSAGCGKASRGRVGGLRGAIAMRRSSAERASDEDACWAIGSLTHGATLLSPESADAMSRMIWSGEE